MTSVNNKINMAMKQKEFNKNNEKDPEFKNV